MAVEVGDLLATLRADTDPASALKGAIHRPKTEHHKPLSPEQVGDFAKALDSYGGYRTTVIALRLMLLTFVRTIELRAARWEMHGGSRKKPSAHFVPSSFRE